VVFLHGWALSDRTYKGSLDRLARQGHTVLAPALPGFRGTDPLPEEQLSLPAYGVWVADFLAELGVEGPVALVGHSFGGAVAICCAHDHPRLVSKLVLVNSIGGSTWSDDGRPMSERPWGDWGVHLGVEMFSRRGLTKVLPVVASDALTHAALRPATLWRVGRLARRADLGVQLEEIKRRRLPVAILWGREDTVVPWACAESLIEALGDPEVVTVAGDHAWLISDPGRFVEVLTNVLDLAEGEGRVA
jgi:pimeloyl-ACP methyl ester carboxylesterase